MLVNLRDHGMAPQEAVDHPRHYLDGGVLLVEGRVPEHEIASCGAGATASRSGRPTRSPRGGAQVVRMLEDGVRAAGSDPRKDGCALAQ